MSILRRVKMSSRNGERELLRLAKRGRQVIDRKTQRQAAQIVRDIRRKGDRALLAAVQKYDGIAVKRAADLRMPLWDGKMNTLPVGFVDAFEEVINAIDRFHAPQVRQGYRLEEDGVELEELHTPLRRVGIYIPGGRFPYPSSVAMTVIPARLAGVEEIVVVTPPKGYRTSPALRYALDRLSVQEIWGIGGAQAIGALAWGTETVKRVDKIVGPGNSWVSAAKQAVSGIVGTDGVPGPTEVVIFADGKVDPDLIAADLLAQAEHDTLASAILVTTDQALVKAVDLALVEQLAALTSDEVARESLRTFGCALLVDDLEHGLSVTESIAPEHLQLIGRGPEGLAHRIRSAGAIFVGESTPEVFGDYIAGPSHVLPTCGSARFASALGVDDFIRRSHLLRFSREAAARVAEQAAMMADVEGLEAHAASARRRAR